MKVLFIGNSQLYAHHLPTMVRELAAFAPQGRDGIDVGHVMLGGYSLKKHWDAGDAEGTARWMIAHGGNWDRVVLQEIYNASESEFRAYAMQLDHAIREAGSQTILLATASVMPQYKSGYIFPSSFIAFNDMQITFGRQYGIPVAAAGYAWIRYLGPNPPEDRLFDLYNPDRGHPGIKGTYINACLVYTLLTGHSPLGLKHDYAGADGRTITQLEATHMQHAAWEQAKLALN